MVFRETYALLGLFDDPFRDFARVAAKLNARRVEPAPQSEPPSYEARDAAPHKPQPLDRHPQVLATRIACLDGQK